MKERPTRHPKKTGFEKSDSERANLSPENLQAKVSDLTRNLVFILTESSYNLKRALPKIVPILARLTAATALLASYLRPALAAADPHPNGFRPHGNAVLALPESVINTLIGLNEIQSGSFPEGSNIQVLFNQPQAGSHYHSFAQIALSHYWEAFMSDQIVGDPSSQATQSIRWYGAMGWGILALPGDPQIDQYHFWVENEDDRNKIIFDARQNIDRATTGCWPVGTTDPLQQKGPSMGVQSEAGGIYPYFENTTIVTLRITMHDNITSEDLPPIEVPPNGGYGFPYAVSAELVARDVTGRECARWSYDWSEPLPTPTSTATPSHTPTQTETPYSSPTRTQTPTNTPTNTPTITPSPTRTQTPTNTPTNTPTITPSPTPTKIEITTNTPTITPSSTPTIIFELFLPSVSKP